MIVRSEAGTLLSPSSCVACCWVSVSIWMVTSTRNSFPSYSVLPMQERKRSMIPSCRRITTTKLRFALLPIGQVGVHKALEDPPMIGGEQMDEFMDDDKLAQRFG